MLMLDYTVRYASQSKRIFQRIFMFKIMPNQAHSLFKVLNELRGKSLLESNNR